MINCEMVGKKDFEESIDNSYTNFKKLLKLVKENPDLPVFPIVDENICDAIEFNVMFNLCKFGKPDIMRYCCCDMGSGSPEMYVECSEDCMKSESQGKAVDAGQSKWKKAIFVPINK